MNYPKPGTYRHAIMTANNSYARAVREYGEKIPARLERLIASVLLNDLRKAVPDNPGEEKAG